MTTTAIEALRGRERSAGAIVFHTLFTVFAALIVISAMGLRAGAKLVPLVIGIPVLLGMLVLLARAIIGRVPVESIDGDDAVSSPGHLGTAGFGELAGMAAREMDEDNVLATDEESVRKRRVFVVWAVLTLVIAWLFGFYVAMAAGLVSIYRYARVGWVKTLLITAVLIATIYGGFDVLLGVRL